MPGSFLRRLAAACLAALLPALPFALRAEPAALRGVALVDQRGKPVTPASLNGRVLLLNFVYTGCSATCPTQVRELAALHEALPASARAASEWLSVSVDPQNDTPAALAEFARRMGAERSGWRFATGVPSQVDTLLERMRVMDPSRSPARPEDHRTSLYLFDARGELVMRFAGVPVDRARLQREITQLAAAGPSTTTPTNTTKNKP